MNTTLSAELLSILFQINNDGGKPIPFMLIGESGIGKTEAIKAIAAKISEMTKLPFPAEIWSAPQIQAEDAAGLPVPNLELRETMLLPLRLGNKVMAEGRGVLVLDEFGSISPEQEAAFLNLLQGGTLGERILPNSVSLGAIANPEETAANGRSLSAPAANRFFWMEWGLDSNVWLNYMRNMGGIQASARILPSGWESKYGMLSRSLVASFIQRHPKSLHAQPQAHQAGCAWPSPRSWENCARLMAAVRACGYDVTSEISMQVISGCVGLGQAQAFIGWYQNMSIPDPEEVLASNDPMSMLPARADQLSICLESIVAACTQPHKDLVARFEKAASIVFKVFQKKSDVAMVPALTLCGNVPKDVTITMPEEVANAGKILRLSGVTQ